MRTNKLIVAAMVAACFGAVAYAAAPRRPAARVSRASVLRSQYNPFLLRRQAVAPTQARASSTARVAAVRPPYRPETRSPYQPPVRGPYIASAQ